jgi:hypothetical protein
MRPKTSLRSLARLLSSLLVLLGASLASPGAAQQTASSPDARGEAIARQLFERNLGYGDVSAELELVLRSERGEESRRALRLRMLERREEDRGDLSLLLFDSPADVRGTALLSHAGVLQGD